MLREAGKLRDGVFFEYLWGKRSGEIHAALVRSVGGIDAGSCRKSASCWGEKWLKGVSSPNHINFVLK